MEADHCFNIYDGKKALLVAAANQEEKIQWMEDIAEAAQVNAKKLVHRVAVTWIPRLRRSFEKVATGW